MHCSEIIRYNDFLCQELSTAKVRISSRDMFDMELCETIGLIVARGGNEKKYFCYKHKCCKPKLLLVQLMSIL